MTASGPRTTLGLKAALRPASVPEEDTSGGFERGGWLVPHADEGFGRIVDGWFAEADPDNPVATGLNGLPKYVVSTTLADATWNNTTVLAADIPESVAQLKAQPGRELQVHGSCLLARTLHDAGLVDEYRLLYFPVVVGQTKRLFDSGCLQSTFTVEQCATTNAGAVALTLRPTSFVTADLEMPEGGAEAVRERLGAQSGTEPVQGTAVRPRVRDGLAVEGKDEVGGGGGDRTHPLTDRGHDRLHLVR